MLTTFAKRIGSYLVSLETEVFASRGTSFRPHIIFTAAGAVPRCGSKSTRTSAQCRLHSFCSFGIISRSTEVGARGRGYITAHERTQLNRVCYFLFFDEFLASRGSSFRTYYIFTSADAVLYCSRKKSPSTSS